MLRILVSICVRCSRELLLRIHRTHWSRFFGVLRNFRVLRIFVFVFQLVLQIMKILWRYANVELVTDPPQALNLPAVRNVVSYVLVPSNSKFFPIPCEPHFANNATRNEDVVKYDYVHLRFQPPFRLFEVFERFHDSVLLLCHRRRLGFGFLLFHHFFLLLRITINISLHLTFGPENLLLVWGKIEALEISASTFALDILPSPWNPVRKVAIGPTDWRVGLRVGSRSLFFRPIFQSRADAQHFLLALDGGERQ
mmetsp:Transcript_6443/g.12119  ORF Transcript_6443/g.12119 Transcript_6443/m.12119 type:complete len:253 (+) Transcript_6443:104-862(+)